MTKMPLNGRKTHPLTPFAIGVLEKIARAPLPPKEINPGVKDRLFREDLIEIVQLPSPYKKGGNCAHLQITEAGRKVLSDRGLAK